ncbi:MAG: hypothetical protein ABSG31_04760 [Tepidisphaeraceae bacterium]
MNRQDAKNAKEENTPRGKKYLIALLTSVFEFLGVFSGLGVLGVLAVNPYLEG